MLPGQIHDPEQSRQLLARLEQHMGLDGYRSFFVPIIEDADLFLIKAGDQIINQLFTFERHGRQLALRPEVTAAAAYYYAQQFGEEAPVMRWQFSGTVFEDTDRGARERLSAGAELVGLAGPAADAEIIALAALGATVLGYPEWRLTIGHAQIIRQALARYEFDSRTERFLLHHLPLFRGATADSPVVIEHLDSFLDQHNRDEMPDRLQFRTLALDETRPAQSVGGRTQEDIARRLHQKQQRRARRADIMDAVRVLSRWIHLKHDDPAAAFPLMRSLAAGDSRLEAVVDEWSQTIELLRSYQLSDDHIQIQPDLVRSWDYYTGIVFELTTPDGIRLGGGGRYDELVQLVGGRRPVPAVGFAYYLDALFSRLPAPDVDETVSVILVCDSASARQTVEWAQALRARGIRTVLLSGTSDKRQQHGSLPRRLVVTDSGAVMWQGATYQLDCLPDLITDLTGG